MSSKTSSAFASATHPPVGTLIDGGVLELVEVLGVGGYGVVYRAVDTRYPSSSRSYAVKCLVASGQQSTRQKQAHIREITLHQLASAHPGVVSLHRVVEQHNHTYIIMDYAPDHDLFTQILHNCRYLGDDALIKEVFLQLLDAVEYCHSLRIYHRDLKPENILCYDDGLRVAITDFGLATTHELSDEFRTGSVYHMSPECQGGEFAVTGNYSPRFNDVWSLGIILLNLATGRNPWKSATGGDPTFQAYLRDPLGFLPSVLPISQEANLILVRMLEVDWRERATLQEVRQGIEEISSFYSDGVVFEGSMARCPWESGMEIDSGSSGTDDTTPIEGADSQIHPPHASAVPRTPSNKSSPLEPTYVPEYDPLFDPKFVSSWSNESGSEIGFEPTHSLGQDSSYGRPWPAHSSACATLAMDSPIEPQFRMELFHELSSSSSSSDSTPASTAPTTPNFLDVSFPQNRPSRPSLALNTKQQQQQRRPGLLIATQNLPAPRIYDATAPVDQPSMGVDPATEQQLEEEIRTAMMHSAIDIGYDPDSSMFFLNTPIKRVPAGTDSTLSGAKVIRLPASAVSTLPPCDIPRGIDEEMTMAMDADPHPALSHSSWTSSSSSASDYSASTVSSRGGDVDRDDRTTLSELVFRHPSDLEDFDNGSDALSLASYGFKMQTAAQRAQLQRPRAGSDPLWGMSISPISETFLDDRWFRRDDFSVGLKGGVTGGGVGVVESNAHGKTQSASSQHSPLSMSSSQVTPPSSFSPRQALECGSTKTQPQATTTTSASTPTPACLTSGGDFLSSATPKKRRHDSEPVSNGLESARKSGLLSFSSFSLSRPLSVDGLAATLRAAPIEEPHKRPSAPPPTAPTPTPRRPSSPAIIFARLAGLFTRSGSPASRTTTPVSSPIPPASSVPKAVVSPTPQRPAAKHWFLLPARFRHPQPACTSAAVH